MKKLNNRSTSSSSLRGANAVCDVAIQRRCRSSVIPHFDAVSRRLSSRTERSECELLRGMFARLSRANHPKRSVVRRAAFTLVELVITIAIVIILSVISVPIYRGYVDKAKYSEAYALMGTIFSAQKAYYSEYGNFYHMGNSDDYMTSYNDILGIDIRGNKYFTNFYIYARYGVTYFTAWVKKPVDLWEGEKTRMDFKYNITSGATFENF